VPENLVFAGTPLIEQPLGLVFGEGATGLSAKITDLVFAQPPRVYPTRLVFGCQRRLNIEPPCRFNIEPGLVAEC